ncbi:MAG TPA: tRNA preQ1(34) S-adenosylmethionine ribosyltransferase-isomerase QueA [bacterium]|jgi:S-adenosylmethionine:tRNA ribosyltransferase-isomerase
MKTELLDYQLPDDRIGQTPAEPRDSSKLLHVRKNSDDFTDLIFRDLPSLLKPGDILVTNNAKVMHARLYGYKHPSGARIEVFLLEHLPGSNRYKALLRRKRRLEPGDEVLFPESDLRCEVVEVADGLGDDVVEFSGVDDVFGEIERTGNIPLPVYITEYNGDMERYQTVYAKQEGSVAAPTAGLHFTPVLLMKINEMGVHRAEVHLRVGWGTFSPIRTEEMEDHKIHTESGEITAETADAINSARKNGGRVIAVGTTVTRMLESSVNYDGEIQPFSGPTDLYITPGFDFRAVDVLITNFHLPRSSLLALTMAFGGYAKIHAAYQHAITNGYRFYSFGDCMIIE